MQISDSVIVASSSSYIFFFHLCDFPYMMALFWLILLDG